MIIIALGSNMPGLWGSPKQTIIQALNKLDDNGIHVISVSEAYHTVPYGLTSEIPFVNAVAIATTPMPPLALLRVLKRIEANSGRSRSQKLEPRTLDLDIIAYHERIYNWKTHGNFSGLRVVLPHPQAHSRAFVLRPLAELAPSWHHPVFGLTARGLLGKPAVRETGAILASAGRLR